MARIALALLLSTAALARADGFPGQDRFIAELVASDGFEAAEVAQVLGQARRLQSILDAISRPAEAKPWSEYRPIFLTDARIDGGLAFRREHADLLARVERDTGVPAAIVTAIIGVETSYGRITGSYRVLDALATLGFHYPPRADFFRAELGHLFRLAREERLPIAELKGSYAGAMGWGQFIPSSYRAYAVDGDGDGRRDLWQSLPDIVASIANYFVVHGWQPGAPVALPARVRDDAGEVVRDANLPVSTVGALRALGYTVAEDLVDALPATILRLEGRDGPEAWMTFQNFHVITRYNRSPLYAMAVHQLAGELADDGPRGRIRR